MDRQAVTYEYFPKGDDVGEDPLLLKHTHEHEWGHGTTSVGLCGDEVYPHTTPERNLAYHNAHQMIAQGFHL